MHEEEITDYLEFMLESIELIESRFLKIAVPDDFVDSSNGSTFLDAISMRLQAVGESVRKIQKLEPSFLNSYPEVEWDKIARFRDLISHHYNQIDHEIVFDICKVYLPKLKATLKKIRSDLPALDDKDL
jgi:uncharacterized protein with HEPN domain